MRRFGQAFPLALAPAPLFGADAVRELRDRADVSGCHGAAPTITDERGDEVPSAADPSGSAPTLSVAWGTRLRLLPAQLPRIRLLAHPSPYVMSDVCDEAPCLVLMRGGSPIGFIATGWDVTEELDFDHTELDAACAHVEPTP